MHTTIDSQGNDDGCPVRLRPYITSEAEEHHEAHGAVARIASMTESTTRSPRNYIYIYKTETKRLTI